MKNQHAKHIRNWVCLLAFFSGFLPSFSYAADLLSARNTADLSMQGADPVIFSFGCINGTPGDTVCIPVTVENFNNIVIFQYEIFWNSSVLDFIDIQNIGTPNINVLADFNLSGPNALKVIPLGFPLAGETLPDGSVLFEICFRIVGFPDSTSCIGISPYFDFEVADVNGIVQGDSMNCCMQVEDAVDLVGFVSSCGPSMIGGDGTITVTTYGGTAPYTITGVPSGPAVIPIEGGSIMLNEPSGNYTITITDNSGTQVMYAVEVSTLGLDITTHLKQPTCYKFKNGTIWIKPEGGSEPYSYIWHSLSEANLAGSGFIRNLGDSSLVTSLPDGFYSILVEDNNGCKTEIVVELIDNPFVFDIEDLINASCNGSEDGLIDLSISGATPDMNGDYKISGNLTGNPFTIFSSSISIGLLNPGDYQITVSDNVSQCDTIFTFSIGYSDTITASITTTDPPCAGGVNGSLSIRGRTNNIFGPVYSYTVYKQGAVITSVSGIGGVYNYGPLAPGDYAAVVKDGLCQSDSIFFTIGEPDPMVVVMDGTKPDNCIPLPRGAAWFDISNGIGPYILDAGSGFQDGDTLFNLNSGNYVLTVTDAVGCTATLPFMVPSWDDTEEADITFQFNGTPCDGGTVTVLYLGQPIANGVGVLWSTGEVTPTINISATDTLSVDVILPAPIFCILNDTVHVKCEEILDLDITVEQPLCGVGANGGPYTGTVIVDTANAVAPVTWFWSFPDTTTTGIYSGLAPGKYYVTVVDGLDSMSMDSFEVIAPPTLTLNFSNIDSTSCPETCDGRVRIIAAQGDPAADYQLYWTNGTAMADTGVIFDISDLCAGENIFTVSQDGLCFYNDTLEILAPDSVEINLLQNIDVTCFGNSDGLLEVGASGGTPGYMFQWQGGPSTAMNGNIPEGEYFITVTDSKNCIQTDSFQITQPDSLIAVIDLSATLDLSCGDSNDGIITLNVAGGNTGGYTFIWDPNVSTVYQAANLGVGDYHITVTDSKGCMDTTSYALVAPTPVSVVWPVLGTPACFGDEVVLLIEDVTGGNGNYTYTINSGELIDINEPTLLPSGIYIVSVFDDRGCSADTNYVIMEPDPILLSIGPDDPVIDLGDSIFIVGSIDQSDNPVAMTLWTSTEPVSCATCEGTWVFNAIPSLYTWTVTDINGCQGSASIFVDVDYNRDVYIPNVFSPNYDGRNDDFKIFTGLGVVAINYLHIYDRWGNLVHSETDLIPSSNGAGNWDGTYNEKELNPGVYVYVAEITFADNMTLIYRGDITLLK